MSIDHAKRLKTLRSIAKTGCGVAAGPGEYCCRGQFCSGCERLIELLEIMDATPAPESPAPAPGNAMHALRVELLKPGFSHYQIDTILDRIISLGWRPAPEVGTGSETSPDAGASREAERMSETLYRAMSEREALRKALAEIHTLSGRRFASMEDVNHIAYAAITATTTPKAEQSPSFLDVEPARKHHRDCVSLRGAPNCNCDRQDWYEILKGAATKGGFINRMSMLYLDTFAKAIRAVLSEAKPAEASEAEQIPHPVAEAEQSPQPAGGLAAACETMLEEFENWNSPMMGLEPMDVKWMRFYASMQATRAALAQDPTRNAGKGK